MLVPFYRTTRRQILEDNDIQSCTISGKATVQHMKVDVSREVALGEKNGSVSPVIKMTARHSVDTHGHYVSGSTYDPETSIVRSSTTN
jgi:hypothetical protein